MHGYSFCDFPAFTCQDNRAEALSHVIMPPFLSLIFTDFIREVPKIILRFPCFFTAEKSDYKER